MSEPFFIGGSKGKFYDGYTRYLPALEPPPRDKVPLESTPSSICPEWSRRQWAMVLQLKSQQEGFQERFYKGLNEIKQKSTPKEKRKPKY